MKISRFIFCLALCLATTIQAATVKISTMTATTTMTPDSLIEVSYWNGSTFVSRKMKYSQLEAQTGTNAAAISTNATKSVLALPGMATHVDGRGAMHTWAAVMSNQPVRFLVVGDSVAGYFETTRGVRKNFDAYMPFGGFGTTYGETEYLPVRQFNWYLSGTGEPVIEDTVPSFWLGLTNGQVITSVFGSGAQPAANKLSFYYKQNPAFGSMLIETQLTGGWGTLGTITATGAAADRAANFALPSVSQWSFRLSSTGTNQLLDAGIINTTATNTHSWARQVKAGALLKQVITNTAFMCFLTNYQPHCIFFEALDPPSDLVEAMRYAAVNFTNSDLVFISGALTTSTEPLGAVAQSASMVEFARTNIGAPVMLFNKMGLFQPTNYWHNTAIFPESDSGVFKDGTHLGALGIIYTCMEFARWFGAGPERFYFAGLTPSSSQTNDTSKANLTGGNVLTGEQIINGNLSVSNNLSSLLLWTWDDPTALVRLRSKTVSNPFSVSDNSGNDLLVVSNLSGVLSASAAPIFNWTYGTPALGVPGSPYYLRANNLAIASNTVSRGVAASPETPGQAVMWNSNGVVYLLTSGFGSTWTATNKLAP